MTSNYNNGVSVAEHEWKLLRSGKVNELSSETKRQSVYIRDIVKYFNFLEEHPALSKSDVINQALNLFYLRYEKLDDYQKQYRKTKSKLFELKMKGEL